MASTKFVTRSFMRSPTHCVLTAGTGRDGGRCVMSKVSLLLDRLHAAEIDLGDEWRKVGERHATDHDVWHTGHQLAEQCAQRAEQIRGIGKRYDASISEPHDVALWAPLHGQPDSTMRPSLKNAGWD